MARKARPRLGRGLSSLMGDQPAVTIDEDPDAPQQAGDASGEGQSLHRIDVASIVPSSHQPRRSIDESGLAELAASIRSQGVLQPIIVRPITPGVSARVEDGGEARWELVAGERRWRAARIAGLERVPAIAVMLEEHEAAEWAFIENVQREDLDPIERAWALRKLCEEFGLSHGAAGERVGLARASVTNLVRLTELEDSVQALVSGGELTMGHARALLAVGAGPRRIALAKLAALEGWSVREMEKRATKKTPQKQGESDSGSQRLSNVELLEKQLGEHLGTRVSIRTDRSGAKGRLVMEFFDLDHFDGLMRSMGFRMRS